MNPEKKYTIALIKTIFTQMTIIGILIAGNIIYAILKDIPIINQILKYNNPFFYFNNLILLGLIGIYFFTKAKQEEFEI